MISKIDLEDEDFQQEFLRGVDELAEEAGPWQAHLPYEACISYRQVESIRHKYSKHVDGCSYCRELIDIVCRILE